MTGVGFVSIRTTIDEETGVNWITLHRPERRNALSAAMVSELKEALALAAADARVRAIGLAGEGPDFCSGADLAEVQASIEDGILSSLADAESLGELFLLLRRLEKPVLGAVHGRALAGGCGLATACDLVIAADTAQFGYPEVKLGFVPAMVMALLRRSLGEKRAFELIAVGDAVDATTAARLGLVNRVVPEAEFDREARAWAEKLARRSASALALSKRLLYQTDGMSFEAAIAAGAQVNALARLTDDCRSGISKFLDR